MQNKKQISAKKPKSYTLILYSLSSASNDDETASFIGFLILDDLFILIFCIVKTVQLKLYTLLYILSNVVGRYEKLYTGKKKGLNRYSSSLFVLYIVMCRYINLGIWWRWRELNPRPPALHSRILHA